MAATVADQIAFVVDQVKAWNRIASLVSQYRRWSPQNELPITGLHTEVRGPAGDFFLRGNSQFVVVN